MGTLKPNIEYIYETSDNGKKVYAREKGSNEKRLVGYTYESTDQKIQNQLLEIVNLSKDHESLKKALDHLFTIYNLVKNNSDEIFWHPV